MLFCLLSNFPRVVLEDDQIYFICGQGGPERKFQLNIRKKEKKKKHSNNSVSGNELSSEY